MAGALRLLPVTTGPGPSPASRAHRVVWVRAPGPVIGLMVFAYFVSRFLQFLTAWTAVGANDAPEKAPDDHLRVSQPEAIRPGVSTGDVESRSDAPR